MSKKITFIILIISLCNIEINAQCCSAGSPSGVDGIQSKIQKGDILLQSYYRHSYSEDYFHKSEKLNLNNIDNSFYDFTNLSIAYGINDKLSFYTEMGYFIDKIQNTNLSNSKEEIKASGFGDLNISSRYNIINNSDTQERLSLNIGLIIPIGAFNELQNGIYVPISLQPSSGALKIKAGAYYSKRLNIRYGLISLINFQWSDRIEKEFLVYKYGNYIQFTGGLYYNLYKKININGLIKYEYRNNDKRENDMIIESTGGHILFINPILSYNIKNWLIILNCEIPFYKYVNGYQLTNQYAIQFGIKKLLKR